MSDGKLPEGSDEVVQLQITHMAKQAMQCTGASAAVVITVLGSKEIQSAIATRVDNKRPQASAELLSKAVRAITLTAAGALEQSTQGKYRLLIMGPNGVVPASEGLEAVLIDQGQVRG